MSTFICPDSVLTRCSLALAQQLQKQEQEREQYLWEREQRRRTEQERQTKQEEKKEKKEKSKRDCIIMWLRSLNTHIGYHNVNVYCPATTTYYKLVITGLRTRPSGGTKGTFKISKISSSVSEAIKVPKPSQSYIWRLAREETCVQFHGSVIRIADNPFE